MKPHLALLAVLVLATAGCATAAQRAPSAPRATTTAVATQIITASEATSEPDLTARAEAALLAGRYMEAQRAYDLLLAAGPSPDSQPAALQGAATAHEGTGDRAGARTLYHELARRFPTDARARAALARALEIHVYLEEWAALSETADLLLARDDLALLDRALGLGARALARIQRGDEAGAQRDLQAGLDLVEENRLGEWGGRTPVAVAQLRFTVGEMRRRRAERLTFVPTPPPEAFGGLLEARCAGLLDAAGAYADAMHAVDAHWAAMAGFRVGEMYRTLHRDVMAIPVPPGVKSERERQLFFAAMRLRYRILLEKGLKMMNGTLALSERSGDQSEWVARAGAAKRELEAALSAETAQIAASSFSEDEVKAALDLLIGGQGSAAQLRPARTGRDAKR